MKLAGLSIDVDSLRGQPEENGYQRSSDRAEAYTVAVPRALDLLDRHGARATFFLIANEAENHPELVHSIAELGHEVASYSATHPGPFTSVERDGLRHDVRESRAVLESLCRRPVVGFRAPNWHLSRELLGALAEAGYRYDASAYPSILGPLIQRPGETQARLGAGRVRGTLGPTTPHRLETREGPLVELPLCTVPGTRLPYDHRMRLILPRLLFAVLEKLTLERRGPITYRMDARDFLEVERDSRDPRGAPDRGRDSPLSRKLELADRAFTALSARRRVVPLRDIAERVDRNPSFPVSPTVLA